jgi:hypothetical protein
MDEILKIQEQLNESEIKRKQELYIYSEEFREKAELINEETKSRGKILDLEETKKRESIDNILTELRTETHAKMETLMKTIEPQKCEILSDFDLKRDRIIDSFKKEMEIIQKEQNYVKEEYKYKERDIENNLNSKKRKLDQEANSNDNPKRLKMIEIFGEHEKKVNDLVEKWSKKIQSSKMKYGDVNYYTLIVFSNLNKFYDRGRGVISFLKDLYYSGGNLYDLNLFNFRYKECFVCLNNLRAFPYCSNHFEDLVLSKEEMNFLEDVGFVYKIINNCHLHQMRDKIDLYMKKQKEIQSFFSGGNYCKNIVDYKRLEENFKFMRDKKNLDEIIDLQEKIFLSKTEIFGFEISNVFRKNLMRNLNKNSDVFFS